MPLTYCLELYLRAASSQLQKQYCGTRCWESVQNFWLGVRDLGGGGGNNVWPDSGGINLIYIFLFCYKKWSYKHLINKIREGINFWPNKSKGVLTLTEQTLKVKSPTHPSPVRNSDHPKMGQDSLKIEVYVLWICNHVSCDVTRINIIYINVHVHSRRHVQPFVIILLFIKICSIKHCSYSC